MPHIHKTVEHAGSYLEEAAKTIIPKKYEEAANKEVWVEYAVTGQAGDNWWDGLVEAHDVDRWRTRIREAGDAAIRKGMKEKGAKVIKDRIIAELNKYRANIRAPMTAAIEAIETAPPKTRDVAENIRNRLVAVINAQRRAVGRPEITL